MKRPRFLRGFRIGGGGGKAPTTAYSVLFSGQGAFSSPCQRNRGEGPSAAPRAHGPELLSGAPLWGRAASRGRGVRREAACAAVGGAAGIVRLSHMS